MYVCVCQREREVGVIVKYGSSISHNSTLGEEDANRVVHGKCT